MVQVKNERRSGKTLARHQGLRDALIGVAEVFIVEKGLAELKARDLAAGVGCSVGAIYNVFPDLDALILEVNAETLREIDAAMGEVAGPEAGAVLVAMADAYLSYAAANRRRWDALFQHRLPGDAAAPEWYLAILGAAFSHIERPMGVLRADLPEEERALLSRSVFSAVHGMAALGLDRRVAPVDLPVLREQVGLVVRAMVKGLAQKV